MQSKFDLTEYVLWLDTETTSLDPNKGFAFQLAYFGTKNGEILFHNNLLMRPKDIEKFEFDKNGYEKHKVSLEEIKTFPLEEEQIKIFKKDLSSVNSKFLIAGYNPGFDIEFLKAIYSRTNLLYNDFYRLKCDVMQAVISKSIEGKIKPENFKLETLVDYFDIKFEGVPHNAFYDAAVTMLLNKKLCEI
ncbi:MAG: 3'-5' exonuclease [Staphylococcus sp.]|nr:3'-5' exonuclease [Staphylococcus sp.]